MGPADGRFAIATIRHLLDNTQALIEGTGTACVCALLVELLVGGLRDASEQHNKARHQKYEYRSHESRSHYPGTIAVKTKRPFSGPALFTNAVKFLRISHSAADTGLLRRSRNRRHGRVGTGIAGKPAPPINARQKIADDLVEQIGLFEVHCMTGLGQDHEA